LHPKSLAAKVNAYIDMILIHLYKPTANNTPELSSSAKWTPPLEGTVLVNLHGAMFSSKRQMVLGSLYEITLVHALLCVAERYDDAAIAELAEALAIGRALSFAHEEGFPKIIIASDFLSVIQLIKSAMTDRSTYGTVIGDIKFRFSSCAWRAQCCCSSVS
jgi:hypothetical protein